MPAAEQRAFLDQMFGEDHPQLQQIQLIPYAARLQMTEEAEAEIKSTTDPEARRAIQMEWDVFRNLLRLYPPVDMSPEDEAALNQHFKWGPTEEEQDHIDEYFANKEDN